MHARNFSLFTQHKAREHDFDFRRTEGGYGVDEKKGALMWICAIRGNINMKNQTFLSLIANHARNRVEGNGCGSKI